MLGRKVAVAIAAVSVLFVSAAAHATHSSDAIPSVLSPGKGGNGNGTGHGNTPGGNGDSGQGKDKGKGNDSAG